MAPNQPNQPDQPGAKRPRVYSPEEEEIVIHVYKYVQNFWMDYMDCSLKTSEITGIETPDIYRMVCERQIRRQPITILVDERTLKAIRRKIYGFFQEIGHGVPTPENILREVNEDERLPNFAMPTFRRVLRHLKYRHFVTQKNRFDVTSRCETFSIPVV